MSSNWIIDHSPQFSGWTWNIYELPPPSTYYFPHSTIPLKQPLESTLSSPTSNLPNSNEEEELHTTVQPDSFRSEVTHAIDFFAQLEINLMDDEHVEPQIWRFSSEAHFRPLSRKSRTKCNLNRFATSLQESLPKYNLQQEELPIGEVIFHVDCGAKNHLPKLWII